MGVISSRIRRHRRTRLAAEMACTWNPRRLFPLGQEQGGVYYPDDPNALLRRRNLLTYSQQFDNAAWSRSAFVTVTGNTTVAPDGTTTADTVTAPLATYPSTFQTVAATPRAAHVFSIYAKAGNQSGISLELRFSAGDVNTEDVFYSLSGAGTATVNGVKAGSPVGAIESVGSGWYRLTLTKTNPASGSTAIAIVKAPRVLPRVIRLPGRRFRIELTPPLDLPRDAAGEIDVEGAMAAMTAGGIVAPLLTITGVSTGMNGDQFQCVATNTSGTATSSAVTVPPSEPQLLSLGIRIREGQRALDQVKEHGSDLVAAHDDDQESGEANGCHGRNRILGGRSSCIARQRAPEINFRFCHSFLFSMFSPQVHFANIPTVTGTTPISTNAGNTTSPSGIINRTPRRSMVDR